MDFWQNSKVEGEEGSEIKGSAMGLTERRSTSEEKKKRRKHGDGCERIWGKATDAQKKKKKGQRERAID